MTYQSSNKVFVIVYYCSQSSWVNYIICMPYRLLVVQHWKVEYGNDCKITSATGMQILNQCKLMLINRTNKRNLAVKRSFTEGCLPYRVEKSNQAHRQSHVKRSKRWTKKISLSWNFKLLQIDKFITYIYT